MLQPSFPNGPGSYLLGLRLTRARSIDVGALGSATFTPGLYVYAGSAMGPGGIKARLGRHWSGGTRNRWHVDYLRAHARVAFAAFATGQAHVECQWAAVLRDLGGTVVVRGFGASDCRCPTHLIRMADDVRALQRALASAGLGLTDWVEPGEG